MLIEDKMVETETELENIEATLASARERAQAATLEIAKLEQFVKAARGTGDVTEKARAVALPVRIETALRAKILTTEELAKTVGVSAAEAAAAIKSLRNRTYDIGTPAQARWTWKLGPDASTEDVRMLVERLITDQPMTFQDLIRATGLRDGLIQGALVDIRRVRKEVLDLGTKHRARWFLPLAARPAYLGPKRKPE